MARVVRWYQSSVADTPTARALVAARIRQGLLSVDHLAYEAGRIVMALRDSDVASLRTLGLDVSVGEDMQVTASRVRAQRATPLVSDSGGFEQGFVSMYLDTDGVHARFAALHAEFPSVTRWETLPESTSGYTGAAAALAGPNSMRLFRITTAPASVARPAMLLIAGAHAREWVPPLCALEFAEQLLRNHASGSADPRAVAARAVVDALDVLIVPVANPDGVDFAHHDNASWRKNLRVNPSSPCRGVDLNRNYPTLWGTHAGADNPCDEVFAGAAPSSEPEARNILSVLDRFPNILTAVDCHSFGEKFFRAHATDGEPVDSLDEAVFADLEAAMNAAIASVSPGKSYATGTTNNLSGTLDDYLYLARRIYGFTLECANAFQPPIDTALHVTLEVAAALRALATRTVALASATASPVKLCQVIDRSGSMVSARYDNSVRLNARRFIDLLSLGDSTALVSFASTAVVERPLTLLDDPGDAAGFISAVDGIHFGGRTSIGAGLSAAALQLNGTTGRRAAILLSDGYQNTPPAPDTALASWPSGVPVYTIALGPEGDIPALQNIASATGGQFFQSPDEVVLHEIYNAARALAADEELSLNEVVTATRAGERIERGATVEDNVIEARFALSWWGGDADARLRAPPGANYDALRVRGSGGNGWHVFHVRRPTAGVWRLHITPRAPASRITASLACSLSTELRSAVSFRRGRAPVVTVRDVRGKLTVASTRHIVRPASVVPSDTLRTLRPVNIAPSALEGHGEDVPRVVSSLEALRAVAPGSALGARPLDALIVPGASALRNVTIRVEGHTRGGRPYVRLVLRTTR